MWKGKRNKKGRVVDLFGDEACMDYLKENIEELVGELSKQFTEPTDCSRELVQNSLDAETSQINIYFESEPAGSGLVNLRMVFEDSGQGMSQQEKEDFFLTIFKSSKENNPNKIGQYGIGIISTFLLKPDDFIVESTGISSKGVPESWGLHITDLNHHPRHGEYDIEERKGTKVMLKKKLPAQEADALKKKIDEKVRYFCERSRTPIYVDGKFINRDFRLDTPIQVHKTSPGLEYVIGIHRGGPCYELHNNRLKLEEGESILEGWPGLSVLISSPRLHHTFSRDQAKRDEDYEDIMKRVSRGVNSLFMYALERIEDCAHNPVEEFTKKHPSVTIRYRFGPRIIDSMKKAYDVETDLGKKHAKRIFAEDVEEVKKRLDEFREEFRTYSGERRDYDQKMGGRLLEEWLAWIFVKEFIGKKKDGIGAYRAGERNMKLYSRLKKALPAGYEKFRFIKKSDGEFIGLNDILDAFARDGKVYQMMYRDRMMEDILEHHGKFALIRSGRSGSEQDMLVAMLGDTTYADNEFYPRCELKDKTRISERESRFLSYLKSCLSRKRGYLVKDIYFTGHDEMMEGDRKNPMLLISTAGKKGEKGKRRVWSSTVDTLFGNRYDVAVNIDHYMIQQLITIYNQEGGKKKNFSFDLFNSLLNEGCYL